MSFQIILQGACCSNPLSLSPGTTLAQALVQLGVDITADPQAVRALFQRFGLTDQNPPRIGQVIELMTNLAQLGSEGSCEIGALVAALDSFVSPLSLDEAVERTILNELQNLEVDWASIIRSFDRPDRQGDNASSFKIIIQLILSCPPQAESHAVDGIWSVWSNPMFQLRLLDVIVSLPQDTLSLALLPGHRIITIGDATNYSASAQSYASNIQNSTWNSLDLVGTLLRLSESPSTEVKIAAADVLDKGKTAPALLLLGLLQVPVSNHSYLLIKHYPDVI